MIYVRTKRYSLRSSDELTAPSRGRVDQNIERWARAGHPWQAKRCARRERKTDIMDNYAAYIKERHLFYTAGVAGHLEKMFRKSGCSLSALAGELDGIDFNLPLSKSTVGEKAKLILEMLEAPSHNASTHSLMGIALSFAIFGLGLDMGECSKDSILSFLFNLLMPIRPLLVVVLAIILIFYIIFIARRSGARQRLVQALRVLASTENSNDGQDHPSKDGVRVRPRCSRCAHLCPLGRRHPQQASAER